MTERKQETANLQLRIPRPLLEHLHEMANQHGRSLNSEIALRLAKSLGGTWAGPSAATYTRRAGA